MPSHTLKIKVATFCFLIMLSTSYSQNVQGDRPFNFGFETMTYGKPNKWTKIGSSQYLLETDSLVVKEGRYAASIAYDGDSPDFAAWTLQLPNNYRGSNITLSAYIKTENVTDGYAGIFMRIDPHIAMDNMYQRGITGTSDWTPYEITLAMKPAKTERIVVGGLLVGKGKMWIDDLKVSIDGKDISEARIYERKLFPADRDREFDNGSPITQFDVDEHTVEKLKTLSLIWGFLKYYHPNIAKGNHNWDYELFRVLPSVLNADSQSRRDEVFVNWINSLGAFPKAKRRKTKPTEIKIEPDLEWIKESHFSKNLTDLLLKVKNARRTNEHYYIALAPNVGNPIFKNEKSYSDMKYPDTGFRLLSLFRYWNIIQYYFPYKNLIEEDWKDVLREFIPAFINANNETEYVLAVLELIGRIHDTHANIWSGIVAKEQFFGMRYAPLQLSFIEDKAVVTHFFEEEKGKESGLQIGDIITTINNRAVEDIVTEWLKYFPASNYPTKLRDVSRNLLRSNDTTIHVGYIRNDNHDSSIIKTYSADNFFLLSSYDYKDTCFRLINNNIAYLNNRAVKRTYLPTLWKEIENTQGLIIDNRNYPSDWMLFELSNYLMPRPTLFVKFTQGSIEKPGLFTFSEVFSAGSENTDFYKGKVIILLNEKTQSSSEFHAMAYRVHPHAIVLGSTTAAADGNVSEFYLPGMIRTMISGIGVYYPDGTETQRIGIVPDFEIRPTIRGVTEGRDEVLEKAIELINRD